MKRWRIAITVFLSVYQTARSEMLSYFVVCFAFPLLFREGGKGCVLFSFMRQRES
jgi:hypothetical protein